MYRFSNIYNGVKCIRSINFTNYSHFSVNLKDLTFNKIENNEILKILNVPLNSLSKEELKNKIVNCEKINKNSFNNLLSYLKNQNKTKDIIYLHESLGFNNSFMNYDSILNFIISLGKNRKIMKVSFLNSNLY